MADTIHDVVEILRPLSEPEVVEILRPLSEPVVLSTVGWTPSAPEIVAASSLEEETEAFAAGAKMVIRTDLL